MKFRCNLCPRKCNAIRTESDNFGGFCKMPYAITCALADIHFWEEPSISGKNGSGAIFFSGCQLKCVYCQNYEISHNRYGKQITPYRLSEIFKELEMRGAHNINLVSATPYVPLIIEAFEIYNPNIPIVFNSSGYETPETMKMLEKYVDIFLLDFKYYSNKTSMEYSLVPDYVETVKSAIIMAVNIVGSPKYDENDIMQSGVIVRHLLLPSNTNSAIDIINWLKKSGLPIVFSLMNQYTVMPNVPKAISRKVTEREYEKVTKAMLESGIDGYCQEKTSSNIKYVPKFNLLGI